MFSALMYSVHCRDVLYTGQSGDAGLAKGVVLFSQR